MRKFMMCTRRYEMEEEEEGSDFYCSTIFLYYKYYFLINYK